jgi:hypothetical protein
MGRTVAMKRAVRLLLALALLVAACARSVGGANSGVEGTVVAGPTCPVERADSPCPDRPAQATVVVADPSGATVTTARTDPGGRFRIPLPPGRYTVRAGHPGRPGMGASRPVLISVPAGGVVRVRLVIDTGIR